MLRESMGGEGVQVSDASKNFQQQQQHLKQQQQSNSSNMASSSTSSSSSGGGGLSYANMQQHYSHANAAVSPSSTASSASDDGQKQQRANNRNSMNSNSGMDAQQQQQQQHAQYQNQIMNAAAAMNSGAMSQVTCLVCYNAQVDVMLEPCHHQFHAHCIDRWLNKDKVCPICWVPTQNQRRMLPSAPPAGLYNQQQQQQQGASQVNGPSQNMSRASYTPNTANSGPMGAMGTTPNISNSGGGMIGAPGAPTDVVGGLAGVANMTNEPPNPATMRKGKWTAEESLYCDRLIEEFKKGNLPLAEGTTLRTFLSKLLNCDPMRISKKYTGDQCIGKIIFRRREDDVTKEDMGLIRSELAELEKTYLEREQYNQRRREKRLESELSRDKSRYIAARTLGGYGNSNNSGSTPTAAGNTGRSQMPVPVAPVGHYQQQQQQIAASAPMASPKDMGIAASHHAPFPPTRGPMPLQHPSNASIPRYPLHSQQQHHVQHQQSQQHQQHQQHQQQQPMQATSSHLFNSSLQSSSSSSSGPHYTAGDDSSSSAMGVSNTSTSHSSSHNDASGRPSIEGSFLSANHGSNTSSSQGSSSQHQQQQHQEQQQQQSESFPRVSSIDSFSCLFPRVASIDNFQLPHQGGHNNNTHHQSSSGGYGSNSGSFGDSLGSNSYDHSNQNMVKSISIGDGLNAYFPRIQSLEQLSSLLQEHAPPSPRTKDENESGNNSNSKHGNKTMKEEDSLSSSASDLADRKRMFDSHNASSLSTLSSLSSSHMKEEQQRDAESDLHRRLSPNGVNKATEHSNQIQIPKPLSKMPRSSSGIFPRIPSMDKLPRVPSLDKLPRIPSMDKLSSSTDRIPRIPSMDKLSQMPRIPSHSDMLSRFGSSDHLSSFPSFSNLSSLSTCASFTNLNSLSGGGGGGGGGFKSGFPRNSSIEDILSLVASSENGSGMSSAGSHLQLSALAAVAGEESSQMAAADRKRRLEHAQEMENKKNKLST